MGKSTSKSRSKSPRKRSSICNDEVLELKDNYIPGKKSKFRKSSINELILSMGDGKELKREELKLLVNYRMYLLHQQEELAKQQAQHSPKLAKQSFKGRDFSLKGQVIPEYFTENPLSDFNELPVSQDLLSDLESLVEQDSSDRIRSTDASVASKPDFLYPRAFIEVDNNPKKVNKLSASLKGYYKLDQLLKAKTLSDYLTLHDPQSPIVYFYRLLCVMNILKLKTPANKKTKYRVFFALGANNLTTSDVESIFNVVKYNYTAQLDYFQKIYEKATLPDLDNKTRAFFLRLIKETQDKLLPQIKLKALLNSKIDLHGKITPFFTYK